MTVIGVAAIRPATSSTFRFCNAAGSAPGSPLVFLLAVLLFFFAIFTSVL
jgi:hypothetical protein